ncbi:MAG TPA: hypothetical protein VFO90_03920 [Terrimicrobiaceae bacterium]|nr:hypothetical protein [Terrimicrobiaceae bacterium]
MAEARSRKAVGCLRPGSFLDQAAGCRKMLIVSLVAALNLVVHGRFQHTQRFLQVVCYILPQELRYFEEGVSILARLLLKLGHPLFDLFEKILFSLPMGTWHRA